MLELNVQDNRRAAAVIHDDCEPRTNFHEQSVPWTDFPLEHIKLYDAKWTQAGGDNTERILNPVFFPGVLSALGSYPNLSKIRPCGLQDGSRSL